MGIHFSPKESLFDSHLVIFTKFFFFLHYGDLQFYFVNFGDRKEYILLRDHTHKIVWLSRLLISLPVITLISCIR